MTGDAGDPGDVRLNRSEVQSPIAPTENVFGRCYNLIFGWSEKKRSFKKEVLNNKIRILDKMNETKFSFKQQNKTSWQKRMKQNVVPNHK